MWAQLDQRECLEELFSCLLGFGEQSSNAVLETLKDGVVYTQHRYPPEGITFADGAWRVFYHCHDSPQAEAREHGHFHFFARQDVSAEDWTHVAGLRMDREGQPYQWFAVNLWVTGGQWIPAPELARALPCPGLAQESGLVERWFSAMLCAFRRELARLLERRDTALQEFTANRAIGEVHADRDIYALAVHEFDLQRLLEADLAGPAAAGGKSIGQKKPTPTIA